MWSEVDRSRSATHADTAGFRFGFASLGMPKKFFATLAVYYDNSPRSAAMNMAIDEALLQIASIPSIRFYRWNSPALSFGYFGKLDHVEHYAAKRDLIRRWTGGGIVLHGEDVTYSIVIPASDRTFDESTTAIYERIHCALAATLNEIGEHAAVLRGIDPSGIAIRKPAAGRGSLDNCFANPVRADVMMNGRKIAGAAQRRTRAGLLQQGSIQGITVFNGLPARFANALSDNCNEVQINRAILTRARELAEQKYGTHAWLRLR